MATLEDLLTSGLGGIIQNQGAPLEEALYQRQAQSEREGTFGRGLGISTVTRDALAKARMDAALAAQQAQLSALGQAASVTQGNANRAQQESQFSRNLAQQKNMQNTQLLAQGLGAGLGAVGQVVGGAFGPDIRTGLRSFAGKDPLIQDRYATGNSVPAGGPGSPVGSIPTSGFSLGGDTSLNAGDLSGFGASLGAGSGGMDFSVPDFSGYDSSFGALDLSSLYDQSFNPYQPYDWGNYL